jgi:hypothetical protein
MHLLLAVAFVHSRPARRTVLPLANADMTQKAGDDYAARVYVLFDYPRERLPWATRAKLALAEALYGQPVPTAALNYVWDNRQPVGSIKPNAYTERVRMVVLESGTAKAGQWISESRDLNADFRAAFEGVGIGVEAMNSPAAARTYNVLLGEGRRIAVCLLPV